MHAQFYSGTVAESQQHHCFVHDVDVDGLSLVVEVLYMGDWMLDDRSELREIGLLLSIA